MLFFQKLRQYCTVQRRSSTRSTNCPPFSQSLPNPRQNLENSTTFSIFSTFMWISSLFYPPSFPSLIPHIDQYITERALILVNDFADDAYLRIFRHRNFKFTSIAHFDADYLLVETQVNGVYFTIGF
uniref:Uncharacterized protein n=1 Tax=Panagrolaimus davidi TaxID=227884 RepID=A0A914PJF3_9BILA